MTETGKNPLNFFWIDLKKDTFEEYKRIILKEISFLEHPEDYCFYSDYSATIKAGKKFFILVGLKDPLGQTALINLAVKHGFLKADEMSKKTSYFLENATAACG